MEFVLTRWPSFPDSFISHYLRRSRCCDGIIEFSELGARGAKVERPEGCQTVIDKLVSIIGQRRWATPSLCLVLFFLLLIHRVRLSRVRFDVQLARETFVWIVSTSIRWIRIDVRWVTNRLFSIFYRCFLSIHNTFVVESFETIDVWNGKRNKFDFFSIYMILRSSECQGIRCLE